MYTVALYIYITLKNVIELETKTANQVAFVELVLTLTNE